MMKQVVLRTILVLAGLLAVGCSSTQKVGFDITVKNDTDRPITIWLTKDGPPAEKGWRSPEQIAMSVPAHEERIAGMLVNPGKTAFTGPITGEFARGSYPFLRIYDGRYDRFSDLLAVSRGDRRIDQPLDAGKNQFVVRDVKGRLVVTPDKP
jgi:hypothetical protein